MPTLRRTWFELLLTLGGLCALLGGLLLVPGQLPRIRGEGGATIAHLSLLNLLDHSRAFAIRRGGYPGKFDPIDTFLRDMGLAKAPLYWECVASVPMSTIEAHLDFPTGRYSGSVEEQEVLIRELGSRYLQRPGEFVYVPIRRLARPSTLTQPDEEYYEDCLLVLFPYSQDQVDTGDFRENFRYTQLVNSRRHLGFELVRSAQKLPPLITHSITTGPGMRTIVEQRGTHLTIQTIPETLPPPRT